MKINSMSKSSKIEMIKGVLFIAPSFMGFIFLSFLPLFITLILSLSEWDLVSGLQGIDFIGFDNFLKLFSDNTFKGSFINNIKFAIWSMPVLLIMGFIGAVMINNLLKTGTYFKIIYFLPYISSSVAVAAVWRVIFQPTYGPINTSLHNIGIDNPPQWLVSPDWALFVITLMFVWQQLGYYILLYTTALAGVSKELYEAAEIDGANKRQTLMYITVPMVTPTTFFLSVTGIIASFKVFDAIQVLTQGGPGNSTSVLVYYLYKVSFEQYKFGYGAAISMILFFAVFIITAFQWKGQKSWVNY
ncbi:MAG: carbohydrate ABC transporter permease [Lachnospirales bacterium]